MVAGDQWCNKPNTGGVGLGGGGFSFFFAGWGGVGGGLVWGSAMDLCATFLAFGFCP